LDLYGSTLFLNSGSPCCSARPLVYEFIGQPIAFDLIVSFVLPRYFFIPGPFLYNRPPLGSPTKSCESLKSSVFQPNDRSLSLSGFAYFPFKDLFRKSPLRLLESGTLRRKSSVLGLRELHAKGIISLFSFFSPKFFFPPI